MNKQILCDTCVLIDFLKGHSEPLIQLNQQNVTLFINPIIELEILQGARDKREMQIIEEKLEMFWKLEIPTDNFQLARTLIKHYSLSHGLRLADALIAANALIYNLELFTYNIKDFKFIASLTLYTP